MTRSYEAMRCLTSNKPFHFDDYSDRDPGSGILTEFLPLRYKGK